MSDPISIPTAASSSNGQATGQASSPSARSLRSVSSTNSPPPNLDTDSLALLSQFRSQKAKQQAKFARLEAKAKREERERKKRAGVVEGAEREEVEDGEEDDEEQGFAESEAWGDLERLARLEAGEVLSDEEDNGDGATEDGDDDDDGIMTVGAWRDLVSEVSCSRVDANQPRPKLTFSPTLPGLPTKSILVLRILRLRAGASHPRPPRTPSLTSSGRPQSEDRLRMLPNSIRRLPGPLRGAHKWQQQQ